MTPEKRARKLRILFNNAANKARAKRFISRGQWRRYYNTFWGGRTKYIPLLALLITACTPMTDVQRVNAHVNAVPYVYEAINDVKSPARFYKEGGDCEDYAVAKYYELKKLGVPVNTMHMVYLQQGKEGHAVLWVENKDGSIDELSNGHNVRAAGSYQGRLTNIFTGREIEEQVQ